jgi:hypothetical protein
MSSTDQGFSYGTKKPRKGSVKALANDKRKNQEKYYTPIDIKDEMVGTAKVVKTLETKMYDPLPIEVPNSSFRIGVDGHPYNTVTRDKVFAQKFARYIINRGGSAKLQRYDGMYYVHHDIPATKQGFIQADGFSIQLSDGSKTPTFLEYIQSSM